MSVDVHQMSGVGHMRKRRCLNSIRNSASQNPPWRKQDLQHCVDLCKELQEIATDVEQAATDLKEQVEAAKRRAISGRLSTEKLKESWRQQIHVQAQRIKILDEFVTNNDLCEEMQKIAAAEELQEIGTYVEQAATAFNLCKELQEIVTYVEQAATAFKKQVEAAETQATSARLSAEKLVESCKQQIRV